MIALEPEFSVKRYLTTEVKVGGILGIIFASLLFAAASLGWRLLKAGAIIGLYILISIVFQPVISTYLSILLAKFNVDAAVTSGSLTTIISNITTLTRYFGLRLFFLDPYKYPLHFQHFTILGGINFATSQHLQACLCKMSFSIVH
jgi:magnesium transporter